MSELSSTGIQLVAARVSNFRSLVEIEVPLSNLTVLVGANNAGKTSFLDAIYTAIGSGRRHVSQEDIFIDGEEAAPPRDRAAVIDILIRPVGEDGKVFENFGSASYWTNLWGEGISQDDDLNDFVGIRSRVFHNLAQDSYVLERHFLKEWIPFNEEWLAVEVKGHVTAAQVEPIQLQYIDAKRDLDDDLRKAGSFWRRLTEDLGLDDADVERFEQALSELNSSIIEKSAVLRHLKSNLADLHRVVTSSQSEIEVAPVARRLRDLSKGVDVTFSSDGAQAFPLTRHGMGTRSLASLLVFRAYAGWKIVQATEQNEIVHPFLALEEPEAHLHPQAQRALHRQIYSIPGQRIVSTHSPYFAGQAELDELRLFTKLGSRTTVRAADISVLDPEDIRKLKRTVIATRGDILFSRAIVLMEGETEEQALPIWAEKYWSLSVHELGINFVGIGGDGNYFPFIWLANQLGIDWFILSDAEENSLKKLDKALKNAGEPSHDKCLNVISLDKGNSFELQLVADGYQLEIEKALAEVIGSDGIDGYIKNLDGKPGKGGKTRDYKGKAGRQRALIDCISGIKTKFAPVVADVIGNLGDKRRRFPSKVRRLFEAIDKSFKASNHPNIPDKQDGKSI